MSQLFSSFISMLSSYLIAKEGVNDQETSPSNTEYFNKHYFMGVCVNHHYRIKNLPILYFSTFKI